MPEKEPSSDRTGTLQSGALTGGEGGLPDPWSLSSVVALARRAGEERGSQALDSPRPRPNATTRSPGPSWFLCASAGGPVGLPGAREPFPRPREGRGLRSRSLRGPPRRPSSVTQRLETASETP